jgi:hypothetical protein
VRIKDAKITRTAAMNVGRPRRISMIFLTSAAEARQALGLDAPDKLLAY